MFEFVHIKRWIANGAWMLQRDHSPLKPYAAKMKMSISRLVDETPCSPVYPEKCLYYLQQSKEELTMKVLILGVCLALLSMFAAVNVSAQPPQPCEKVWVDGHYNKYGKWIKAHWKHLHWIPGHHNRRGEWIPGHCG
jgi:hypothetical protein